ncbi:MAG: metal-dependent hydrolase [Flavobacteriales bacterium]
MDSLTQVTLGAAVGEACIGRKAGHKAWLWGAVLGTLPDLDILAYPFMKIVAFTEFHRGVTHSLIFILPLSIALAYLFPALHPKLALSRFRWGLFAFLALITHVLLDCFTTWGTEVFWPLKTSIAWETIFVIDPLYTLLLLIPLILAIFKKKTEQKRKRWIQIGLIASSCYLLLTLVNKVYMHSTFSNALESGPHLEEFRTRPTPLNNFLWSGIARTSKDDYLIGYHTLLDPASPLRFRRIKGKHELLNGLRHHANVKGLIEISEGYYSVRKGKNGNIRFYDLRFGELFFWNPQRTRPVFCYLIEPRKEGAPRIERKEGAAKIQEGDLWTFMKRVSNGVRIGKPAASYLPPENGSAIE